MNSAPGTAAGLGARECDCSPQVERCVHFAGKRLVLRYYEHPRHYLTGVGLFQDGLSGDSCPCGCGLSDWPWLPGNPQFYVGNDYAAALAAFREAEARLIAGGAA